MTIKFDAQEEIWKDIKDFEGCYQISNKGNVRSLERFVYCKSKINPKRIKECILKPRYDKSGYLTVNLKKNQKSNIKKIHRLVAEAYIENPYKYETVNHKNGIKTDNTLENLEWMTTTENSRHRTINLLSKPKLNKNQIKDIIENCRPSKNQFDKEYSISEFARKYNVCRGTVMDIIKGKKLYIERILCK